MKNKNIVKLKYKEYVIRQTKSKMSEMKNLSYV